MRKYYFTITLQRQINNYFTKTDLQLIYTQRQINNYFTKTDLQLIYTDRFTITLQGQITVTSCIPFLIFIYFFIAIGAVQII